jgi:hypothetical protein
MKHLLYLFFSVLLLAGCRDKKGNDPAPKTPAEAVAGLYTMTSITSNGRTVSLPFSGNGVSMSGSINVVAVSGKSEDANMNITFKATGSPDTVGDGPVQVKAAGQGYELFDNGQKIGTVQGNTLSITDDGNTIVAKK